MEYQIQKYDSFRESMKELQTLCNWIPNTSTDEGYEKSKRLGLDGRKIFNALEDARKSEKKDVLEKGRLIDSEAKSIQDDITKAIQSHIDAYKEVDNREKVRKAELEEMIDGRIDAFRNCVALGADMDADELAEMIKDIKADPLEDCYHRTAEALKVRNSVVSQLESTLKQILEEAERRKVEEELAVQREADATLAAEKLEAERIVFEAEKAQAAEERAVRDAAEKKRLLKEAAEQEKRDHQDKVRANQMRINSSAMDVMTLDLEPGQEILDWLLEIDAGDGQYGDDPDEVADLVKRAVTAVELILEGKQRDLDDAEAERVRKLDEEAAKVEEIVDTHISFGTLGDVDTKAEEVEEEPLKSSINDDLQADFALISMYGTTIDSLISESPHMSTDRGVHKLLRILEKLELASAEASL